MMLVVRMLHAHKTDCFRNQLKLSVDGWRNLVMCGDMDEIFFRFQNILEVRRIFFASMAFVKNRIILPARHSSL